MTTNFICHVGWAMVPIHVAKHYSGCFCEGVLDEINIQISGLGVKQIVLYVCGLHSIS